MYGVSYWGGVMLTELGATIALTAGVTAGVAVVVAVAIVGTIVLYQLGVLGDTWYEQHKKELFG